MNRKRTPGLYTSDVHFACVPVAILACACGRIGFGSTGDGGGAGSDAPGDGALVDMPDGTTMTFDAPPSLCGTAGANMCDGFETTTLDSRWQLDVSMGSVSVDTAFFYRGGSSLRAHVDAIGGSPVSSPRGSMRSYQGLPIPSATTYVRVFAFIPSTTPQRFVQWINTSNDSGLGSSTGMQNNGVVNNDYAVAPSTFVRSPTTQFPRDRWVCVTYEVPTGTNPLRVYIDDVEVSDVRITPTMAHPAPTHVYLGLDFPETFSNQPAANAWFDEIMVDDLPITCAN